MNFPKRLNQTKNMFYQSIAPQDLKVRINRQVEPVRESLDEQLGYWLDMKKPAVATRFNAMHEALQEYLARHKPERSKRYGKDG